MADKATTTVPPGLTGFAGAKTLRLTTVGRRSGKPRSAEIWFVVDGTRVYVQAGPDGEKGWYGNLLKDPVVSLAIADRTFQGRALPINDVAEVERVLALFRAKYWLAKIAKLLRLKIGHGKPVAIDVTADPSSA